MLANKSSGFTLVEVIFGIVLMAIVLTIVTGLLAPQAKQSAEPVIQVKANELGQAMMNEILSRSFDENSERSTPYRRCGEVGYDSCTPRANLGPENHEIDSGGVPIRQSFNDVDDYIGFYPTANLRNSLGQDISGEYPGFSIEVMVEYDDDIDGSPDTATSANLKLIVIEVMAPNNEVFGFSAYKGNY